MIPAEIRRIMSTFLTDPVYSTIQPARNYIIPLRRTTMDGYTLVESRCLWFSLMIYKFRSDFNVTDELWTAARAFILGSLRQDPELDVCVRRYLNIFDIWKKQERTTFSNEIIGYYLEVLQLKQTIEETRNESTISEWKDSYQGLIHKIRDAAASMGFLAELDARVAEVQQVRYSLVENMMKRVYWDMIENDIKEEKYTSVLCQLLELKNLVKGIIPSRFHDDLHEKFNVEYIQEKLESRGLDPVYLVQLCHWIIDSIKEWDSASERSLYDREIETLEQAIGSLEWSQFLRFSLERCTLMALDAKTRIDIWRSVLQPKSE